MTRQANGCRYPRLFFEIPHPKVLGANAVAMTGLEVIALGHGARFFI
jgi:hypothetical protein